MRTRWLLRSLTRFMVLAFVLTIGRESQAQVFNYQSRLIGQRALGMGGAYTAVAEDPTATFYNPAGITNSGQRQLELALPIFELDHLDVHAPLIATGSGATRSSGTTDAHTLSVPSSVGVTGGFGPRDSEGRHFLFGALSLYVPYQRSLSLQQTRINAEQNAFHIQSESEQTLLAGPTLALRTEWGSFGISLFYAQQDFSWFFTQSSTATQCVKQTCVDTGLKQVTVRASGSQGSLNFRLGLLKPLSPKLRLGVMASLSSIRMFGGAALISSRQTVASGAPPVTGLVSSHSLVGRDNLRDDFRLPWELRIGLAFQPVATVLLSTDLSFYAPETFSPISGVGADLIYYPAQLHRNFIANLNAGIEVEASDEITLRTGAFSNLSAAN